MTSRDADGDPVSRDFRTAQARTSEGGITRSPRLLLDNRSGYDTGDLRAFFEKGLRAMGVRQQKRIIVVAAPARSRGCAEVGGHREGEAIVIAMAPPSRFRMKRLALLFRHEVTHTHGFTHEQMDHHTLWSLGAVPLWAIGSKIRYRGRAPSQIP